MFVYALRVLSENCRFVDIVVYVCVCLFVYVYALRVPSENRHVDLVRCVCVCLYVYALKVGVEHKDGGKKERRGMVECRKIGRKLIAIFMVVFL